MEKIDELDLLLKRKEVLQNVRDEILEKLSKITQSICVESDDQCKANIPFECCDDHICEYVEQINLSRGLEFNKPNLKNIKGKKLRYLGSNGCEVPYNFRELCTQYICDSAKDKLTSSNHKEIYDWEKAKQDLGRIHTELEEIVEVLNQKFKKNYFSLFKYNKKIHNT